MLVALAVPAFPAAAQAQGLDVVGKSDLGGAGLNGQVAVSGDTAIVGSGILAGGGLRSSFRSTYPCPPTTVKVVDLSSPSTPTVASEIPVVANAVANDVDLLPVNTPDFTGDLAAVALVRCNFEGNFVERGVAYYDVTDRANPEFLGRYDADQNREQPADPPCGPRPTGDGFRCASSQDQVTLVQRPDGKVLSLSTEPFSSASQGPSYDPATDFHGDMRIVDVTNPAAPVEVGSYPNGPATAGGPDEQRPPGYLAPGAPETARQGPGFSNNGCRAFQGALGVGAFPDGSKALLPFFDQGLINVDLADPAAPSKIGQWSYDLNNRALEGNAAYADFASAGGSSLALLGETDWIAPSTSLRIDAPSSVAGSKFGCEAAFTLYDPEDNAQIYRKPGSQVPGEIVYVGRGCPGDNYLADPAGKIAFRDRNPVASRQSGATQLGPFCGATAASKEAENRGAIGVIVGGTSTSIPQTPSLDGDPPAGGLSTPTMGIDTGDATALRDSLCPAPATPGTGCGPGGETANGAMVDSKGDWGALRVVDVGNPAAPTLRGTYRTPTADVFPPPDRGIYSVHHAVGGTGNSAYVAAHADGVRVIDLASPTLAERGSFVPPDTPDPTSSIPPKAHVTGVDAGPGGTIVISDTNSGLYVLRAPTDPGTNPGGTNPGGTNPGGTNPGTSAVCPPASSASTIRGTARNDRITGTVGADRILSAGGNDIVDALPGNDCVDLGTGADLGQGSSGRDVMLGGRGIDRISGNAGNDRLRGGAANDRLAAGPGNDRAFGDTGNDLIQGGFGSDVLHGMSGNDRVNGSRGRDRINGGSGNDALNGGSSPDRVSGDRGNDQINGNSGRDRINGNSGNDRINARDGQRDRIDCGTGRDRVIADRIDRVARNCERVRRR